MNSDCRTALSHLSERPAAQGFPPGAGRSGGTAPALTGKRLSQSATIRNTPPDRRNPEGVSHLLGPVLAALYHLGRIEVRR